MKRNILLLVLLLVSVVLLVSCSETPDDLSPSLSPEEMLVLMENGAPVYQVIRSDSLNGQHENTKSAIRLISALKEKTGIELKIGTDYSGKGGTPQTEYEILVGTTNRPESEQAMNALGADGYLIRVIGTKLCIVATDDRSMRAAIDDFLENYVYFEGGKLFTSNTLSVDGGVRFDEDAWFIVSGPTGSGETKYDEAIALACMQGIMNRESSHKVYIQANAETEDWLEIMRSEGRWMEDVSFVELSGFAELLRYGQEYIKTVIIWDENVPATINVATTIAGVEDGIVMSASFYKKYQAQLREDIKLVDLRGQFDGSVTGSAKNDAYAWAIENYLETGLCSTDYICSYIDAWSYRKKGNTSYAVVRDWGVYHRAFVYDLSPWGDEAPLDDPEQELGLDKSTLIRIYNLMYEQTKDTAPYEVCGFFEHQKYSQAGQNTTATHSSVSTEWEYAALMSPYNGFHNTCIDSAWNESLHGLYTGADQLISNRPSDSYTLEPGTVYICFFMGDYDSTHPVYRYLKQAWDDPRRGELPFAWAINPNLLDTYPDLIEYYYETATENDYFVSDASAAGYFMPSRVPDELWPNMLKHNIEYFNRADMTIAPMVLDRFGISGDDVEMLMQFAPDGIATVLQDKTYSYKGTVVTALLGGGYDRYDPVVGAENLAKVVEQRFRASNSGASLNLLRCVWSTPSVMCEMVELYQEAHPDQEVVVVDIYNYFDLIAQDLDYK